MGVQSLYYLCYLPAVVFVVHVVVLFFSRRLAAGAAKPPPFQFWLQDLMLAAPAFAASMLLYFDRAKLATVIFPALSVVLGIAAGADVCSSHKVRSALWRAVIYAAVLAGFIKWIWLFAALWFLWKFVFLQFLEPRPLDKMTLRVVAAAALIYFAAFLLPMGHGGKGTGGFSNLTSHGFGSIDGQLFGFGAYYQSFMVFFEGSNSGTPATPAELTINLVVDPTLAWMANPCFWLAALFQLEGRRWMSLGLAALGIALAASISGVFMYSIFNSLGYGVWFLSLVLLGASAVILALVPRRVTFDT